MQESNGGESSDADSEQTGAGVDSEATSKDTLSDIEENEAEVDSDRSDLDPGPSPDGALDEGDEIKDAGPM